MSGTNLVKDRLAHLLAGNKDTPFPDWCLENIYLDGLPFSFAGHAYLEELYHKHHHHEVFQKAAQTGISTRVLLKTLWKSDKDPTKVLYYFSTDDDVEDFSDDRVSKVIEESPYLSGKTTNINNKFLKQIGMSSLYFRGMFSKRKVKSVNGDIVVIDEMDECDQENKEFAFDRVLHSSVAWKMELSQPSLPGFAINESFEESDQRYWLLKCPHCNHWCNVVDYFPECLVEKGNRYFLGCEKCGRDLDTQRGLWAAKFPSKTGVRGYHVSSLYSSIIPQGYSNYQEYAYREWKKAKNSRKKKRFYISVVGTPYSGDEQPLNDENLKPALGTHMMLPRYSKDFCYMGVDVGDLLHIKVGTFTGNLKKMVVWIEETESWDRLDEIMKSHSIDICCIDAMPYKNSAKKFARRWPEQVYIQYFKGDSLKRGLEGDDEFAVPKVTDDRTESLDTTVDELKDGEIILPSRTQEKVELAIKHLKKLIKEKEVGKDGGIRYVYKKRVENHLGFALNSMRIAMEIGIDQYGMEVYPSCGGSTH
jgi:Phage terminase large subunit gpA, ATPase domain